MSQTKAGRQQSKKKVPLTGAEHFKKASYLRFGFDKCTLLR
jgi:hypothetical protein